MVNSSLWLKKKEKKSHLRSIRIKVVFNVFALKSGAFINSGKDNTHDVEFLKSINKCLKKTI